MKPSIFANRRGRVETLDEALRIFIDKISPQSVRDSIVEMLADNGSGQTPAVNITITVRRDEATPGKLTASIKTKLSKHLGEENFYGLEG